MNAGRKKLSPDEERVIETEAAKLAANEEIIAEVEFEQMLADAVRGRPIEGYWDETPDE